MSAAEEEKSNTEQAPPEAPEEEIAPLQINDQCEVAWRGGEQYLTAIVVERRPVRRNKRRKTEVDADVSSLPASEIEYYVHFQGHDRRLDEWVTLDKFKFETLKRYEPTTEDVTDDGGKSAPSIPAQESRLTRRRSSASAGAGGIDRSDHSLDIEPFSFTGGNWHGGISSSHASDPALAAFEREHEEMTKVKNVEKIVMGSWEVEAWYYSPFPAEYSDLETLYVCEFCLTYMRKQRTLRKHRATCQCRHPPGKEIYREGDLSVYEIDGKEHRAYCQKLCLLAKLFLDHKTLYYDVNPFYFYIVSKVDEHGAHIVGYFSKEKVSNEGYNLACILTFPQYQQAGYGKFIISLSYELTKREGKTGSPEKPLSDLGKVSYRSYWTHVIMNLLANYDMEQNLTINDMSEKTGIKTEDLISTLQSLDLIKVWKGQHVIYVRQETLEEYRKQNKHPRLCKPEFLMWEPPSTRPSAPGSSENPP